MGRSRWSFSRRSAMARLRALLVPILVGGAIAAYLEAPAWGQTPASDFIRGDANGDGQRDLSDSVFLIWCSFLGTECPACADAGDVNDDGASDLTDPVALLNYLY